MRVLLKDCQPHTGHSSEGHKGLPTIKKALSFERKKLTLLQLMLQLHVQLLHFPLFLQLNTFILLLHIIA